MKLRDVQSIERLELIRSNTDNLMTGQLTKWVEVIESLDFVVEQLKKNGGRQYQIRQNDNERYAVFVDSKFLTEE